MVAADERGNSDVWSTLATHRRYPVPYGYSCRLTDNRPYNQGIFILQAYVYHATNHLGLCPFFSDGWLVWRLALEVCYQYLVTNRLGGYILHYILHDRLAAQPQFSWYCAHWHCALISANDVFFLPYQSFLLHSNYNLSTKVINTWGKKVSFPPFPFGYASLQGREGCALTISTYG